jgi:imidazolonepropionase-like amidohydrolase
VTNVRARNSAERGGSEITAVVGATIMDGNGGKPIEDGVILIQRGRIVAIGDRTTAIPAEAKKIGVSGKFVIPGLMDSHHYLVDGTWVPGIIQNEGRYDEVAIEAAQLALKGGVTTVFDSWGPREPLIKARDKINEGLVTAARLFICGNWLGLGGPFSADMRPAFRAAVGEPFAERTDALWEVDVGDRLTRMTLEQVRKVVRDYVRSGIDFVTYLVNAHRAGAFSYFVFSPAVQRMIVEEAHAAGLAVQALFATNDEGIRQSLDVGADIVIAAAWGGDPTSPDTLGLMARKGVGIYLVVSTDEDLEWMRKQPASLVSPEYLKSTEAADLDLKTLIKHDALLIAQPYSGILTADQLKAWGRDCPPGHHVTIGEGHIRGLRALQQKGMTPMNALISMTRNVARAFKVDKDLGTLEQGKLADLVILDRSPLESPENYRSIYMVLKDGKVVDRDSLPTQRLWTAPPPGAS